VRACSPLPRQTNDEITVRVALGGPLAGLRRTDVACKIMPGKMRLAVDKGAPALEGSFEESINDGGSFWQFEELPGIGRVLSVVLEKKLSMTPWVRAGLCVAACCEPTRSHLRSLFTMRCARSMCWTRMW
jgi:hypothetical protein